MDALDLILTRRSVLARNMVAPGPNDDQLKLFFGPAFGCPTTANWRPGECRL